MGMDILLLQAGAPVEATTGREATAYQRPDSATAKNLGTAFSNVANARTSHAAIATKAGNFSYDSVLRAAHHVRNYLRARPGYVSGARVALQISNSPEYLAAFYGTLLADCVVVPLPVSLEQQRQQKIVELCQPDVLISRAEDFSTRSHQASAATLTLPESSGSMISFSAPHRQQNDLAMLLFTSGSSGMPKGVMLSHRNLLANADSILRALPISADDRTLAVLPFCHAFGNSILQTHILSGATLIIDKALTFPAAIVEALREFGATSFSGVPEVYGMLLRYGRLGEHPLPALRYMTVAGGELNYNAAADIADRIAPASFFVMYGQSEATARLAALPAQQFHLRRGSIGNPISGVELAVLDETMRELPPGTVGMLCARGDNVMLGYWQDPAATADVLSGDGWLQTGDLAHRDEDGFFYLHGRANLLVKVQGYRVHPAEIESVVEANFPETSAIAIPVDRGDEKRFILFLTPRDKRPVDVAKIRASCQRDLPAYKVPLQYEVIDRFPLTSGYKIDRAALALLAPQVHPANTNRPASSSERKPQPADSLGKSR
jgi:acyl-CoA synthetase (AMP-forming)/AMP-acid ligase II